MKKKSFWEYIISMIGLVSGIMTIISFMWLVLDIKITKVEVKLDFSFIFEKLGIWIFICALAICISSILFLYIKHLNSRRRSNDLLLQYSRIMRNATEQLYKSPPDDDLQDQISSLLFEIKGFLDNLFRKPVNAEIKKIIIRDGEKYITNVCCAYEDYKTVNKALYKLNSNTLFSRLYNEGASSFVIKSDKKISRLFIYGNQNVPNYSSYMILPISGINNTSPIVGFLTIYTMESKRFIDNYLYVVLPLLSAITVYLYAAFSKEKELTK